MGGDQNALFQPVPFPLPSNAPVSAAVAAPVPAPVSGPVQVLIAAADLAKLVASKGIFLGAQVAAAHHRTINTVDPPSPDELLSRVLEPPANFVQRYLEFYQGSPNAVALRLLAPRAGLSYPFEETET